MITKVRIETIQEVCSEHFKVSVEDMKSKSRKRHLVIARHFAMSFACIYTSLTLEMIGSHFGNRDHTTVIHARQQIKDLGQYDGYYINNNAIIKQKLFAAITAKKLNNEAA